MNKTFLALGSNLGDSRGWIEFGVSELRSLEGLEVEGVTVPEVTVPLGGLDQPPYYNSMVRGVWSGSSASLLAACHNIEERAGRSRVGVWDSRELDIDLVLFGNQMCDQPALTLPHPGLRDREFWARQIAELERND